MAVDVTPAVAPTSALAEPADYTGLLIHASDIDAPESFTASPPINDANGQPGVTATFSSQDRTRVIVDSIQVLPDPAAAASALESAKATRDGYVHGIPEPIAIGTGGTTISGPSPDGLPQDFVTDVGQKLDAAIKKGLAV